MDKSKWDGEWRESGGGRRIDRRNAYLLPLCCRSDPGSQSHHKFIKGALESKVMSRGRGVGLHIGN